jgi:hypothetical protein
MEVTKEAAVSSLDAASEARVQRRAARRMMRSAIARRLRAFYAAIEAWTLPERLKQPRCRRGDDAADDSGSP